MLLLISAAQRGVLYRLSSNTGLQKGCLASDNAVTPSVHTSQKDAAMCGAVWQQRVSSPAVEREMKFRGTKM
jgi:hypothetical protein